MKVFWSWQSDTPGKTGRHFIRDALDQAVKKLKESPDIDEPSTRDALDDLHIDQDRQGIPGSPDLASTILRKIDASQVFVADVTTIARSPEGKPLINPNVAIELGYALGRLGDGSLLMVMNEHYGSREGLPFDLRHRAGPLLYRLPPDAKRDEIDSARRELSLVLANALRPYLIPRREIEVVAKPTK